MVGICLCRSLGDFEIVLAGQLIHGGFAAGKNFACVAVTVEAELSMLSSLSPRYRAMYEDEWQLP